MSQSERKLRKEQTQRGKKIEAKGDLSGQGKGKGQKGRREEQQKGLKVGP